MIQNNQSTKQGEPKRNWTLIPLILTAFIPLVVYYHVYDTKLDEFPWFGDAKQADVFLYWKMAAIIAISILMLCILVCYLIQHSKKEQLFKDKKIFIPLIIYGVLAMLSTIFSEFSYWGWHGISNQMESVWVLLGYVVITFYAFYFVISEKDVGTVLKWLLTSMGIVFLIGACQAFSWDFYRSSFGKKTYLPGSLKSADISFNFEMGRTYTSLYNPNYVGVLVCLLLPLCFILFLFAKNWKTKLAYSFVLLVMLISLWGSGSKSGMLIVGVTLFFLVILFRRFLIRHWKLTLSCMLGLMLLVFGMNAYTGNKIVSSIQSIFAASVKEEPNLQAIETEDDNLTFHYKGKKLVFTYNPSGNDVSNQLVFTDDAGNILESTLDAEQRVTIKDTHFNGLSVIFATYGEILCFDFMIDGTNFYFTNQAGDNTYYYITMTGKFDKIEVPKVNKFWEDNADFASKRGYIWSRTISLLKDTVILGSGADSFTLVYPNDDYIGRYNYGFGSELISKPHNLYLQMGVQTGVVSVIAFIIFYLLYFVSSIKLYFKSKFDTFETQVGASILAGTFGYMLMGISNDSTITVAPIFWMLMGLGLAVNRLVRKKELLESNKE